MDREEFDTRKRAVSRLVNENYVIALCDSQFGRVRAKSHSGNSIVLWSLGVCLKIE